jgi:hypothetical protein
MASESSEDFVARLREKHSWGQNLSPAVATSSNDSGGFFAQNDSNGFE